MQLRKWNKALNNNNDTKKIPFSIIEVATHQIYHHIGHFLLNMRQSVLSVELPTGRREKVWFL